MDFSRYKPLAGERPASVVVRHPSGMYLALQTPPRDDGMREVGVWEAQTGVLVWAREGAQQITWSPDGTQLVVWRDSADPDNAGAPGYLERRSWPADEALGVCAFALPWDNWAYDLWIAPSNDLAAVRWVTEGISGWELVILSERGDVHLAGAGLVVGGGAAVETHPVVSPSGRFAASGYQPPYAADHLGSFPLRQNGRFLIGRVVVMDLWNRTYHEIVVDDAVPAKLLGTALEWTDLPSFLDSTHFSLMLPTGVKRVFSCAL